MEDEQALHISREEQLEIIRNLRLIDDTFMSKVFEDKECAELLLRIILNREDLTVLNAVSQLEIKNLQGRSSRLDIYAVDAEGKQYDIEVQRDNDGAAPRRARYNSSLMDSNSLLASHDYSELPENYVIFITEHDVLKGGKPIYTINRKIEELENKVFNDGSHIIYVNGEIRDESNLGRLMQDFFCTDPFKMNNKTLSDRTMYFKETEKGVDSMCKLVEDYAIKYSKQVTAAYEKRAEEAEKRAAEAEAEAAAAAEAAAEAAAAKSKKIAVELWNDGMRDIEKIARVTELPLDEVKKLFEGKTA